MKKRIFERAAKIKALLMDVDGVLTDGKMYFFPNRDGRVYECKAFSALDGIGLRLLPIFGIRTGIITGRESLSTEDRARTMLMSYVYQGFLSKTGPFDEILKDLKIRPEEAAYIGDDLTDVPILKRVGLACAPRNALKEVKRISHFVTEKEGGNGAVREVCDLLLKSQGYWRRVMEYAGAACWPKAEKNVLKVVSYSKNRSGRR